MRRAAPIFVLALLALAGCPSNRGQIREVTRPAPPSPRRRLRFELVETASIATGSGIELAVPLASSEPGVQDIERLDVTIKPDTHYEITTDSRGNRTLRLVADAPVEVRITYRVLRTEVVVDLSREEKRPLTDDERRVLAPELASGNGVPMRTVATITNVEVATPGGPVQRGHPHEFYEVYRPGMSWTPTEHVHEWQLIVSHGSRDALPVAKASGAAVSPQVDFTWRSLEP